MVSRATPGKIATKFDEASIARIRTQLASMLKAMRARGIEPGDAIARRIFG